MTEDEKAAIREKAMERYREVMSKRQHRAPFRPGSAPKSIPQHEPTKGTPNEQAN